MINNTFTNLLCMAVEETLKKLDEKIKESEKPIDETLGDMFSDVLNESYGKYEDIRQKYNELRQKAQSTIDDKVKKYNELRQKYNALREQVDNENIKVLKDKNYELTDTINELNKKFECLRNEYRKKTELVNSLYQDVKSLKEDKKTLSDRVAELILANENVERGCVSGDDDECEDDFIFANFAPITYYVVENHQQARAAVEALKEIYGGICDFSYDTISLKLKEMFENDQDVCIYLNKDYKLCCCVSTRNAPRHYLTNKELVMDCGTPVAHKNYEDGDDPDTTEGEADYCNDDCGGDGCDGGCHNNNSCEHSCKKRIPEMLEKIGNDCKSPAPEKPKPARKRIVIK